MEPAERPLAKWTRWAWARAVLVLTALLHTVAFPPFNVPEAAYVFVVPLFLWCLRRPRRVEFFVVSYSAFFLSWLVLLEWLRHVTIGGTIALAAMLAVFPTLWCAALRAAVARAPWQDLLARLALVAGLAGLWVVLEWIRSWFLTGFPWLTLATSQWQRPVMLQSAAYAGGWSVAFVLIMFNLGLASYLQRLTEWVKQRRGRFAPEFYVAVLVLFGSSFALYEGVSPEREPLFRAGYMQPYIPQQAKWEPAQAQRILGVIEAETKRLAARQPDVIFWPEAVTPIPLLGDERMKAWVERLARETQRPIILGAVAFEPNSAGTSNEVEPDGWWRNAMFLVQPESGVSETFYRKRHLVPFGEYVPLRRFLPGVEKIVPIGGDFAPGGNASLLTVEAGGRTTRVGPLICYEDVFSNLSRESVRAGAEVLFVGTNDAWYGETGAAYQHAAHSVVRAVETRRPVIRVGNGGWSGWIDEHGVIRGRVVNARGTVYFRGNDVHEITRDPRWIGRTSGYVQWGDWFVWFSGAVALGAAVLLRSSRLRMPVPQPAHGRAEGS